MIGEGEGTCDNFRFLRLQRYATGISTVLTTSLSAGAIDPEGVAWALDDRATSLTSAYRIIFCVDASYTVGVVIPRFTRGAAGSNKFFYLLA